MKSGTDSNSDLSELDSDHGTLFHFSEIFFFFHFSCDFSIFKENHQFLQIFHFSIYIVNFHYYTLYFKKICPKISLLLHFHFIRDFTKRFVKK